MAAAKAEMTGEKLTQVKANNRHHGDSEYRGQNRISRDCRRLDNGYRKGDVSDKTASA
jgi:hypothetical protein